MNLIGHDMASEDAGARLFRLDRRLVLAALLTLVIALFFWTQSRYPALNDKAAMGASAGITGIAFDQIVELLPTDGLLWEIAANTLNWMYTNWKGMTFGVLFAACALTLFGLIERRGFNNAWANAALGAAIGTPLGVCVNCAAPIARGFHSAGMRLETTLSALVASPTLNVIVVSMSFALLPLHMATLKLLGALAFVLIGVPLLTRFVFKQEAAAAADFGRAEMELDERRGWIARKMEQLRPAPVPASDIDSWGKALLWLANTFTRNLMFIVAVTVPLMLLAGFLGALAISFLPFDDFLRAIGMPQAKPMIFLTMCIIAAVCIVLPVPIAFDVILAVILINAGWPVRYVMTMLFALGCYSIYSYMIVGRAISFKVSGMVAATLAAIAVLTGLLANEVDDWIADRTHAQNMAFLAGAQLPEVEPTVYETGEVASLAAGAVAPTIAYSRLDASISHSGAGGVSILSSAELAPLAYDHSTPFTRLTGPEIGIHMRPQVGGLEMFEPFAQQWPAASGDIDGDGWNDIAIGRNAHRGGLELFRNIGGEFGRVEHDLGPVDSQFVGSIALVNLDSDDRPDLFVSTFLHGTFIFWNREGRFDWDDRVELPNGDAGMAAAPGFADLDGDGDLEIVAANWTLGTTGNTHDPFLLASRDRIFWNEGDGKFTARELEGIPGESLSSLIADIDRDGRPDILIGDDVSTADKIYLNRGARNFSLLKKSDGIIPYLTNTTMSFDMGDVDGDLSEELYSAQIAWETNRQQFDASVSWCSDPDAIESNAAQCFEIIRNRAVAVRNANAFYSHCEIVRDPHYRAICAARSATARAGFHADASQCQYAARFSPRLEELCQKASSPRYPNARTEMEKQSYVGGVTSRNLLYSRGKVMSFTEVGEDRGVDRPGWSWNSKFVDLDQDGWLDLLVASGHLYHRSFLPNRYYRNQGDGTFRMEEKAFGLSDAFPTSSYLQIDYDRDGDVDIIRPSAVSQPLVHRNDAPAGKALWIRLEDGVGNRAGIGARVILTMQDGSRQLREIRQSGGFASADRPQAHFGVGKADEVAAIEILWRDGAVTKVTGPVPTNREIVVRRSL